jgi:hypothetical protein
LNLRHDTDYTEGVRGFSQSSCTFLHITINCATIAALRLLSNSLFTVLLARATNKHRIRLPSNKDTVAHVNNFVSHNVYTENLVLFRGVNVNLTLCLPSHIFNLLKTKSVSFI